VGGGTYFHGVINTIVETDAKQNFGYIFLENGISASWNVQLMLSGDSSEYSNVWVRYLKSEGSIDGSTSQLANSHTHFDADLTVSIVNPPPSLEDEAGPPPPITLQTLSPKDMNLESPIGDGDADNIPFTGNSTTQFLGAYHGGSIFDFTDTNNVIASAQAWPLAEAKNTVKYSLVFEVFATPIGVLTPVPEPGTWAMMLAGGLLVGWQARRRGAVAPAAI